MYAIVRTGGKQYRVEEGRSLDVELLPEKEGASIELDNVLMIADDGDVTVGTPIIEGARVMVDVESHGREKKIVVFKYKSKVRTRKKTGHRQHFTRLAVTEILKPGEKPKAKKAAPKRKASKSTAKAEAEEVAEASVATDEAVAEASAPEAKPKRTRKPATPKAAADASGPDDATDEKSPAKEQAAPKRTRKAATLKAASAEADSEADASAAKGDDSAAKAEKKPARKRSTKKADEDKE